MRLKKEEPRKKRREKSKKEILVWEVTGFALFILAFIDLILPLFLSEKLEEQGGGWQFVVAFFLLMIGSAAVLLYIFPDVAVRDMEKGIRKYGAQEFAHLSHVGKQEVRETFLQHGFLETEKRFYRKKLFSATKDSVCYYVALTDGEDVKRAWETTGEQLAAIPEKAKCVCLLIFLYKAQPTKQDKKQVKEFAARLITHETVIDRKSVV